MFQLYKVEELKREKIFQADLALELNIMEFVIEQEEKLAESTDVEQNQADGNDQIVEFEF